MLPYAVAVLFITIFARILISEYTGVMCPFYYYHRYYCSKTKKKNFFANMIKFFVEYYKQRTTFCIFTYRGTRGTIIDEKKFPDHLLSSSAPSPNRSCILFQCRSHNVPTPNE